MGIYIIEFLSLLSSSSSFFFLTLFREETKTCIFFEDMRCVSFGSQVVAVMNYDSVFNLTT